MLFDPGGVLHTCPLAICGIVLSDISTSSATPEIALTRLNHFSRKAYGPQLPCLRLTYAVTDVGSRLSMECAGSALFQSHFQRPADKHFVAHRYDAIAMLSARRISLFVFCAGTFPGIRPFFALRSENYGRKLPILPLLGNLEIGMSRIFHNWKALPYLNSGAYRIISVCFPPVTPIILNQK